MASDNEHRTQHWVQLIAIANSSGANDAKMARLDKEVEELKSAVHRSRSPRMRSKQRAPPQSQKMFALLAPASSSSGQQRNRRGKGEAGGKGSGGEKIMDTLGQTKAFSIFHPSHKEIASSFRKVNATMLQFAGGSIPASVAVQRASLAISGTVSSQSSTDRFSLNFLMISRLRTDGQLLSDIFQLA